MNVYSRDEYDVTIINESFARQGEFHVDCSDVMLISDVQDQSLFMFTHYGDRV